MTQFLQQLVNAPPKIIDSIAKYKNLYYDKCLQNQELDDLDLTLQVFMSEIVSRIEENFCEHIYRSI